MSGGQIGVAPAVLLVPVVVVGAAVVVGAGLAAALVIRTAQAGAETTGRALEELADAMERKADAQDQREAQARLWGLAASATVRTNQQILLLAARAEKAGVHVPLPGPFDLTGRQLADARDWVIDAERALADAWQQVERAETERTWHQLVAALPTPAGSAESAADLLAAFSVTLADRRRRGRGMTTTATSRPVQPKADEDAVRAEIDEILGRLDVDATAAEREEVIILAARAVKQRETGTSRTYLDALIRRVDESINRRAADRRDAAGWLTALEHPLVAGILADAAPPPPRPDVVERLRAVVRGDAELTAADRRDAGELLSWAQRQVERRRLLEVMAETLEAAGYTVTTGMRVQHTAALSVARESWRDEHDTTVWVDEAGGVRWRTKALSPDARAEASRCEDINETMRAVGHTLTAQGFDVDVAVPATPLPAIPAYQPSVHQSPEAETKPAARERSTTDEEGK
ncbi:hypothetical protein [Luedemannella helvata]|uniref:Uncharacterized protein n=1 Tax=Luedemannella helvata TaxID=349315 RepID=A0ABP4XAI9_9ACTN